MLQLMLSGRIGKDGIIHKVKGFENRKVINFSVVVNKYYTDSKGMKVEDSQWFDCSLFSDSEEFKQSEYILKGMPCTITSDKIEQNTYIKEDGNVGGSFKITVRKIDFHKSIEEITGQAKQTGNAKTNQPTNDINKLFQPLEVEILQTYFAEKPQHLKNFLATKPGQQKLRQIIKDNMPDFGEETTPPTNEETTPPTIEETIFGDDLPNFDNIPDSYFPDQDNTKEHTPTEEEIVAAMQQEDLPM